MQMHLFHLTKSVHVRAYVRRRFGRDEHVRRHWRSPPSH